MSNKVTKVIIPEAAALPHYTDAQGVSFGPGGFTIDFGQAIPGADQPTVVLKTRVVMVPPSAFVEFAAMCQATIADYEQKFGKIPTAAIPSNTIIFEAKS